MQRKKMALLSKTARPGGGGNSDYSSDFDTSSDEDDKNHPNFWRKDSSFFKLPENV